MKQLPQSFQLKLVKPYKIKDFYKNIGMVQDQTQDKDIGKKEPKEDFE